MNFNGECNGVYHASFIPRKLRSVMKKRKGQSISPTSTESKNQNQLTCGRSERRKKESTRKLKANQEQGNAGWSRKKIIPRPITKDEEEVAETLYALASIFSSSDNTHKEGVESSINKPSALPKATKDTRQEVFTHIDSQAILSNTTLERAYEEHDPQKCAASIDRKHFNIIAEDSASEANIQTISLWSKCGYSNDKLSYNTSNPGIPSRLSVHSRLNRLGHSDNSRQDKLYITKVTAPEIRLVKQRNFMGKEGNDNPYKQGVAPWLGLATTGSSSPARFDSSLFPVRSQLLGSIPTGKVSKSAFRRMSKSRCAMHVYISHLIELLQTNERKDDCPLSQDHGRVTGLNGGTSTINMHNSKTRRDCREDTSRPARSQNWDRPDTPMSSWFYPQKQNFDFLSLSMPSDEIKPNLCDSEHGERRENILEAEPHINLPRQRPPLPLSASHIPHSFAYGDQFSAITMQQLSPYFGASGTEHPHPQCGGSGISMTDQNVQVVPTTQLATQQSSCRNLKGAAQIGWWMQNGSSETHKLIPCAQERAIHSPLALSLQVEAHAPECTPTSQHRLITHQNFPLPG